MSWWRQILRSFIRGSDVLKGTDMNGNQYFEKITRTGQVRRSVKIKEKGDQPVHYSQHLVPPEWDRWLRKLQQDPPTLKEQQRRVIENEILKRKVNELESNQEPIIKQATDHASAPSFKGEHEPSDNPTSTGNTFQPGSWKPPD